MRVATFNILHGRSPDTGTVDADRLRQAVADIDADVIGLQEVDLNQPRSGRLDLAAVAASAYGEPTSHRYVPTLVGTPGQGWRGATDADLPHALDEPSYGIALVTRLPVVSWHVLRLSAAPTRSPVPVGRRRVLWLRDEPRVVLSAVVATPHGPLTIGTTHLSFVPGWNAMQLLRATVHMRGMPAPRVLMGDLNLPAPVPRILTGWRSLTPLLSFPATEPRVQIDHVLATGTLDPVVSSESRAFPFSDHRAVIVEF